MIFYHKISYNYGLYCRSICDTCQVISTEEQKVISTELAKSSQEILVKYSLNCQSSHPFKKSPFVCGHFISLPPPLKIL